jgi:predicted AAA+ superfamily ATPase
MYIPRSIDQQLLEWKQGNVRKPLLLRGARQVGKSSAIRHLGETFEHYIEVNFEKRPELKVS